MKVWGRLPAHAKLCYIEGGSCAYFTTQDVTEQWGDDWNDAPYEHNAGTPYKYSPTHDKDKKPWAIMHLYYEGPFETPSDRAGANSPYSVQDINAGAVAWLAPCRWVNHEHQVSVPAGTELHDFIRLIRSEGGQTFAAIQIEGEGE